MMARLLLAVSVLMGAACGGPARHNVSDVDQDYQLSERSKNGLVIVSTRYSTDCKHGKNASASFHYEDEDYGSAKGRGVIPVGDPFREPEFQAPPGYLVIKELRAGPHHIRKLAPLNHDLSTTFEVEAGKAIYLGEWHVQVSDCDSDFAKVALQVTDQWERDGKLVEQRMKNLRSDEVAKRLVTEFKPRFAPASSTEMKP